jgi:predicted phage terminase large subunit-like protein
MGDAASALREDPGSGWRWLIVRAEEPYLELTWERWERGIIVETGTVECPFPPDKVRARAQQMGPTAAARGLANRPVSGRECVFQPEHFNGPEPGTRYDYPTKVLFADPAGDATKLRVGDPDWCAVVVIGWHPKDKCWDVLAADRRRGSPSQQAQFIAGRATAWNISTVYQEAVKDEALVTVTQQKLRDMGASVSVRAEKPSVNKELRLTQTLEPALAAGTLRVCGDKFPALRDEALTFPAGSHDDLIDALAGAFAKAPRVVWTPGESGFTLPERDRGLFADLIPERLDWGASRVGGSRSMWNQS